jgi:pseudaminic acid biosynthesis-associated methylase
MTTNSATPTKQMDFWNGDFGKAYTERSTFDPDAWDEFYRQSWGATKAELQAEFFDSLPKDTRFLEVGANTGMQLVGLQRQGFTELYGIELQAFAVEKAKAVTENIQLVCGSGFDMPFRDAWFDVVMTNGVLIHISPSDHHRIIGEMLRTSRKFIFGWEYYAPKLTEVNYRGHEGFLWKADFPTLIIQEAERQGIKLREVGRKYVPYVQTPELVDVMYMLEKVS